MCRSEEENHCLNQKYIRFPGVGYDGGHAPYVLVPETRFLVLIRDLDPVLAAPLTDAGITTYSAAKAALPSIWSGSTTVVIGVGGPGLYAVQFLRQLTGARVVAVDSTEARLKLALEYGADDAVASGADAAAKIRELSGGIGAQFVLDCVGVNATLATGVAALSAQDRRGPLSHERCEEGIRPLRARTPRRSRGAHARAIGSLSRRQRDRLVTNRAGACRRVKGGDNDPTGLRPLCA